MASCGAIHEDSARNHACTDPVHGIKIALKNDTLIISGPGNMKHFGEWESLISLQHSHALNVSGGHCGETIWGDSLNLGGQAGRANKGKYECHAVFAMVGVDCSG